MLYDGTDIVLHEFQGTASVSNSVVNDTLISSLTVSSVALIHEGSYTCVDGEWDARTTQLTLTGEN